jgi:hypothetical protein
MRFSKMLTLLLMATGLMFTSCEEDVEKKQEDKDTPEAGIVKGRVVDAQGQPLAGVKVYAGHTTYYNTNVIAVTNSNGNYEMDISNPGGTWTVHGEVQRTYNGKNYTFYVYADNPDPLTGSTGAVRNLTWKLSGPIPGYDDSKCGAKVAYYDNSSIYISGEEIEFTLVPEGKLVDGSTGQTIKALATAYFSMEGTAVGSGLNDVPMGRYRISARYIPKNGDAPQKLGIRLRYTEAYTDNVVINFEQIFNSLHLVEVETKLL